MNDDAINNPCMADNLDRLNAKVFREQLNTSFKVHFGHPEPLLVELIEVNERSSGPPVELFSLIFRGPNSPRLAQHIHSLEHEKLGPFQIFLTPVGADETGTHYESVFHRLSRNQNPGAGKAAKKPGHE